MVLRCCLHTPATWAKSLEYQGHSRNFPLYLFARKWARMHHRNRNFCIDTLSPSLFPFRLSAWLQHATYHNIPNMRTYSHILTSAWILPSDRIEKWESADGYRAVYGSRNKWLPEACCFCDGYSLPTTPVNTSEVNSGLRRCVLSAKIILIQSISHLW